MLPVHFPPLLFVLLFIVGNGLRASGETLEYESIPLWSDRPPGAVGNAAADNPDLWLFPLQVEVPRPAVVILPGGGYRSRAADHEGKQIARWLNELGVHAFVCNYRVRGAGADGKGYGHPVPMLDAQRAVRLVRAKAKQWKVDAAKVGVIGFSAGGHLASTVSTQFDVGDPSSADPVSRQGSRPDFAILCYPVIAFGKPFTHMGSQYNLLGEAADPLLISALSSETRVSPETPPTFLFHTSEDKAVPVKNSLEYFDAMMRHGVPGELHVFARGTHGLGLAKNIPGTSRWPELCQQWMQQMGILAEEPAATVAESK